MVEQRALESIFVDHYYTLGIDTDVHGDFIEATYWRIIREWRAGKVALATSDVDLLNEAYRVLTTPRLRAAYDAEREHVLGPNAKPQPPLHQDDGPPLRVMEKQLTALRNGEHPEAEAPNPPRPAIRFSWLLAGSGGIAAIVTLTIIRLFL